MCFILRIMNNIISILEQKGLKQKDLCDYIGINTNIMNTWRIRKADPPARYIIHICEFLDISPYLLLSGEEKELSVPQLSDNQQKLLQMYSMLSDIEKGEILGELKTITRGRESIKQSNNIQTVRVAARSFDHHPPELVTGDFSDIINAPDATDEY